MSPEAAASHRVGTTFLAKKVKTNFLKLIIALKNPSYVCNCVLLNLISIPCPDALAFLIRFIC